MLLPTACLLPALRAAAAAHQSFQTLSTPFFQNFPWQYQADGVQ
jgi:hypothetical protein